MKKNRIIENPLITIVMSVYNGEKYLKQAIESILKQTYKNFEFLIINDGSIDKSLEIIKIYQKIDKRIVVINNVKNMGLIYSLNKGFDLSKGKYIARMDADDISEKNRLQEQVEYMEKNLDISMCGSYIKLFKNNFRHIYIKFKTETESEKIKNKLLFRNYIAHPTVMLRSSIIKKYNLKYLSEDKGMEDYGLWLRIVKREKIAIIPKYLLKYRFLGDSISSKTLKDIENHKLKIRNIFKRELKDIFENFSEKDVDIHTEISLINNLKEYSYSINEKEIYLKKLYNFLKMDKKYDVSSLKKEISNQLENCYINQEQLYCYFKRNNYSIKSIIYYIQIKLKLIIKKVLR